LYRAYGFKPSLARIKETAALEPGVAFTYWPKQTATTTTPEGEGRRAI
jgi:hypothetical protein